MEDQVYYGNLLDPELYKIAEGIDGLLNQAEAIIRERLGIGADILIETP